MQQNPNEREETIIVAGTNLARKEINTLVRDNLGLVGNGLMINALSIRDMTIAEGKYAKYYHLGDYVQPQRDYIKTGLKENVLYKIIDKGLDNRLLVRDDEGQEFRFNPLTHRKLVIYKSEHIELSKDDLVRVTRNQVATGLVNGSRLKVESIEDQQLTLTDEKRQIKFDVSSPLYLDHAYASTVHSSQGLTMNRVLVDLNTRSLTTTKDVYYVAISRARTEAHIYTNSIDELSGAISRENIKTTALDITKQRIYRETDRAY